MISYSACKDRQKEIVDQAKIAIEGQIFQVKTKNSGIQSGLVGKFLSQ